MIKYPNVPLGQICNIEIGRTPSRNQPKYWGNGYSWLSIADMKNFKFLSETKEQVTDLAIGECNMKLVPQGTLLFSFKLSVGKVGIASKDLFTNEAIAALKIKSEKEVYQPFLYHALGFLNFDGKGDRAVKGITLNKAKLRELLIPLPSLSEQKRIAEILDKADALRQKNKQLLAAYDELQQATFLDMFGDPITNPKGLEKVNLNKIARLERGRFSPRPRNDPSYFNGPYPFIQTGDISKSGNRLDSYTQTLNDKGIKVSKRFEKGTIVIAIVGATIGATAILELDVYATDSIIGISVNKKLANNIFLEFVMQFWKPILLKIAPEAARANINLEILGRLDIIVPPITFQDQFAKVVENIEAQKTLVKQSLQESEDLFNGLVQKAFGG